MNLEQFLTTNARSAWIKEPGLEYYVRRSVFFPGVIELANCNAPVGSKQFGFWRFLKKYAKTVPFIAEQVINEGMAKYLRSLGWAERDIGGIPQFASPLCVERWGHSDRFRLFYPSQEQSACAE
jgi:hypothetical protein